MSQPITAAAAAASSASTTTGGTKKPPIARGAKPKGAGSVRVGKVTVDQAGLTIKEWQKTPKQLLLEYAKGNNTKVVYRSPITLKDGKLSVSVVLPDSKGRKEKDLVFTPTIGFPNVLEAEHGAALIALKKVDGNRQHDKKLPEPYRTAWLEFDKPNDSTSGGSSSSSSTNNVTHTTETKDEVVFECDKCSKTFKKEHGLAQHKKKEHPPPKVVITTPGNEDQGDVTAVTATTTTTTTTTTTLGGEGVLINEAPIKKKPPKPLSVVSALDGLSVKNKFSSLHEERLFHEAQQRKIAQRIRREEALERNNRHATVFMNAELRQFVESVVKHQQVPVTAREFTPDEEAENEKIFQHIVKLGFTYEDTEKGLLYAKEPLSIGSVLDYLCTHLPEENLPPAFDPRGKQFEVVTNATSLSLEIGVGEPKTPYEVLNKWIDSIPSNQRPKSNDLVSLYSTLLIKNGINFPLPEENVSSLTAKNDASLENENIEEWDALLSTVSDPSKFVRSSTIEGNLIQYKLPLQNHQGFVLELNIIKGLYPECPPMGFILHPSLSMNVQIELTLMIARYANEQKGFLSLFPIWDYVDSSLTEMLKNAQNNLVKPSFPLAFPGLPVRNAIVKEVNHSDSLVQSKKGIVKQQQQQQQQQPLSDIKLFMLESRKTLPAFAYRNAVIEAVNKETVVLISGDTGCGKTTQIPQFILEDAVVSRKSSKLNIICTQPRRIAAIGVATRVAEEMNDRLGNIVGYQVRLDSKISSNTRLQYVTTGILLRMIQSNPDLEEVTHIIVDEVHERSMDTDFLLALLRQILEKNKSLKLVLMSATMDSQIFVDYFSSPSSIVKIPGRTFPVEDIYLKEVLIRVYGSNVIIRHNSHHHDLIDKWDDENINYDLIGNVCGFINDFYDDDSDENENGGAILVFVSGLAEISRACDAIERHWKGRRDLFVLALHGGSSLKDQNRVFTKPRKDQRKVIVSTNVAETSITIDDVVYVVDTGRHKENRFDPGNKMSMLVETWISKASAKQRRGRAGRVRSGKCFKLYSEQRMRRDFPDHQLPEISRAPLENVILKAMSIGNKDPHQFMENLVQPPPKETVQGAVQLLGDIGACDKDTYALTALGNHLADLPMDIRLGKMLIFGSLLRCAQEMIIIAAALSTRPIFIMTTNSSTLQQDSRKVFGTHSGQSDHIAILLAFQGWNSQISEKERYKYAEAHGLNHQVCKEIFDLKRDFARSLEELGFSSTSSIGSLTQQSSIAMIKAALCAGLYPNIISIRKPIQKYEEVVGGVVEAKTDPRTLKLVALLDGDEQVYLHPASMNFDEGDYRYPWLVYREKVQTKKLYVREVSCVSPYAILLFGGRIEVIHDEGLVIVESKIAFKAQARIGVLVKELRSMLNDLLTEKISNPLLEISQSPVIDAIYRLICTGGYQ